MLAQCVFFVIVILCSVGQYGCTDDDENFSKLIDAEWQCKMICIGSGGTVKFIPEYRICKCWIGRYIEDGEIEQMLDSARSVGLKLITVEPLKYRKNRTRPYKREIAASEANKLPKGTKENKTEPAVADAAPVIASRSRNILSTEKKKSMFGTPAKKNPTVLAQNPEIEKRMRELQNRLAEFRQQKMPSKSRTVEDSKDFAHLTEKIRAMVEERKKKLTSGSKKPVVGSKLTKSDKSSGKLPGKVVNSKALKDIFPKRRFEIITQDPRLVDDDDN